MTENWDQSRDRDEGAGGTVRVTLGQLRQLLTGFDAAGAHDALGCDGECPDPAEHSALALLRDLICTAHGGVR